MAKALTDEFSRRFANLIPVQAALLREACAALLVELAEIADYRFYGGPDTGEDLSVVIVTAGGRKLRYPTDDRTKWLMRDAELEREQSKAKTAIEEHRRVIHELEQRHQALTIERHDLALQQQT